MSSLGFLIFLFVIGFAWFLISRRSTRRGNAAPASGGKRAQTASPAATRTVLQPSAVPVADARPSTPQVPRVAGHDEWKPAVRETLAPETIMTLRTLVGAFPELPVGTRQVMIALQDPNASPQQIARMTGSDPALAARILRVVNSSFYNLPNNVSDLSRAIVLLGYTQVRNLVLQGGVGQVLAARNGGTRIDLGQFWYHSFCTATCAFHFARKLGQGVSPGQASTLGLLHDLGKPVWWWAHGDAADAPPTRGLSTRDTLMKEEATYGANHQVLGALLALEWGLPTEVVRGVEYHHHPGFVPPESVPEDVRALCKVVWMADRFAHRFAVFIGDETETPQGPAAVADSSATPGGAPDTDPSQGPYSEVPREWDAANFPGLVDNDLHNELLRARALVTNEDVETVKA